MEAPAADAEETPASALAAAKAQLHAVRNLPGTARVKAHLEGEIARLTAEVAAARPFEGRYRTALDRAAARRKADEAAAAKVQEASAALAQAEAAKAETAKALREAENALATLQGNWWRPRRCLPLQRS